MLEKSVNYFYLGKFYDKIDGNLIGQTKLLGFLIHV